MELSLPTTLPKKGTDQPQKVRLMQNANRSANAMVDVVRLSLVSALFA